MISVKIFALNPRIPKGMLNDTWNMLSLGYVFLCFFFRDYRIVLIEQVTEMNDEYRNSHQRMFCSLVIMSPEIYAGKEMFQS